MHKKNILMIVLDECKATALGCYGGPDCTPNIDNFAKKSYRFENAFVTMPKCVPSRTSLFTSRYCHTEGHRTLPDFEIYKGENNLIKLLKDQGYKTAMFGKNHTFMPEAMEENLDVFEYQLKGIDVPWERREFETDDDMFRAFYRGDFSCIEEMRDTIATKDTVKFLQSHEGDKPFFTLLNYNAPHPPYTDIEPYISKVKSLNIPLPKVEPLSQCPKITRYHREVYDLEMLTAHQWRQIVEAYHGMMSYVDDQIEQVLDALKNTKHAQDTIVVITSDHGDFAGEHGCVEKWDTIFYDCITKIPLMIYDPLNSYTIGESTALCENIDIAPTILELCGIEIPRWMVGRSLCEVMRTKSNFHRDAVFSEGGVEPEALQRSLHYNTPEHAKRHPNYLYKQKVMVDHPESMIRAKMIRTDKYKLVYRTNGEKEFYNLLDDPGELHDVSNDPIYKEIIIELTERLLRWCIDSETNLPLIDTMYA